MRPKGRFRNHPETLRGVRYHLNGKNRIMIFGPKDDATCVVEFRTSDGEVLAISMPRTAAHVILHFQKRMPYGYSCRQGE